MSLSAERNTVQLAGDGRMLYLPVAAGKKIYQGSLVVINGDGFAEPGKKAAGLKAAGRAENTADNTAGGNGDIYINVQRGVFIFDNTAVAANQVKQVNILDECYILDDETVTMLAEGTSLAGKVIGIADGSIAVQIGL